MSYARLLYTGMPRLMIGLAMAAALVLIACGGGPSESAEQHLLAAQRWHAEDRFEGAIAAYGVAISLDSFYTEAFSGRGNVYYDLGQLREALLDYNEAISLRGQLVGKSEGGRRNSIKRAVAEAYAGKAKVLTLRNRDLEAQQNGFLATDFGYDPDVIQEEIRALKERR